MRWFQYLAFFAVVSGTSSLLGQGFDLNPEDIRSAGTSKKPVSVLQNRYFLKAWRPEFGVLGGSTLNEAYTDTKLYGARFSLFINEWVGFEGQFIKTVVTDSTDRKVLNRLRYKPIEEPKPGEEVIVTPDPDINPLRQMIDANGIFAPFYGKLNFLDLLILYTDIYVVYGMSFVKTDQGNKNAALFGAGERFYIGNAWSVRVDARNRIFNEQRGGETSRRNAWTFDVGVSYFFF